MKAEQGVLCVVFGAERVARAVFEFELERADSGDSARAHFKYLALILVFPAEDEHSAVEACRAGFVHVASL